MNWVQARKILWLLPAKRSEFTPPELEGSRALRAVPRPLRARSVAVMSGKGGAGKSIVSASLARLLGRRGRTLLFDADLGVGNAHILQGVTGETSLVDVVDGRAGVSDVRVQCGRGVDLVGGGSGVPHMAELTADELYRVARGLESIERDYRYVVADGAAGVSNQTVAVAAACDLVLLVTTPDLTAMTDAYAFEKVLARRDPKARSLLVVNRACSAREAEAVARRIQDVSKRFLQHEPHWIGWLPDDPAVSGSINRRTPVVDFDPHAPVSLALGALAKRLCEALDLQQPRGMGLQLRSGC